jgi:hypothetical protein
MVLLTAAAYDLLSHDTSYILMPDNDHLEIVLAGKDNRKFIETALGKDLLEVETEEKSLILLGLLGKFTVDTHALVQHFHERCPHALPPGLLEYLEEHNKNPTTELEQQGSSKKIRGPQKQGRIVSP